MFRPTDEHPKPGMYFNQEYLTGKLVVVDQASSEEAVLAYHTLHRRDPLTKEEGTMNEVYIVAEYRYKMLDVIVTNQEKSKEVAWHYITTDHSVVMMVPDHGPYVCFKNTDGKFQVRKIKQLGKGEYEKQYQKFIKHFKAWYWMHRS
jgi:hypothetical protein